MKYLLKNGTVVTGEKSEQLDILVEGEKIVQVGKNLPSEEAQEIDVSGKILFPGFIDGHTHFDLEVAGTVTADDFETGTKAAILGGTTFVIDYASQDKGGHTLKEGLDKWHKKADDKCSCDYSFHMSIVEWNENTEQEIQDMIDHGITSFKLYMTYPAMIVNDCDMYKILKKLGKCGCFAGVHCENAGVIDALIAEAKKREMYILMDLVVNHCSDEHEWFQQAIKDPDGKYGNFFYIRDKKDDKAPCNWRSYFGGPVWEELPGHPDKQYLHVFHKKQPDLNWENPEVREEVYKNIRWWMEKGLGGFRIDAIINIKKKLPFSDYPADRADGLCSVGRMLEEAEGIGEFLGEMAEKCFHPYDAFTVGEVFNEKEDEIKDFIGENGYFSSMFDFEETCYGKSEDGWYASKPYLTPEEYKKCIFHTQKKIGDTGMISNIIENHDEPRGVCHYISPEKPGQSLCP